MRVDAFRPIEEFKGHMDQWIERFRTSTPVDGQEKVLIPGDPVREMEEQRKKEGLHLLPSVVEDLQNLGKK